MFVRRCIGLCIAFGFTSGQGFGQNVAAADAMPCRYVNGELPGWLRLAGEERVRFEDLDGIGYQNADNSFLLHRLRLNLDATPLPWLKFSFQAQDSLVFFTNVSPVPPSQKNTLDLRVGYLQVGNAEADPVSVRAGRQALTFGEGRLVADPNWSNVGRTFDGVRMTLHYRKVRLDAFTGAWDQIYTNGFATPVAGQHFDGLYGSLDKIVPGATIEPYLFWKMEHNVKGELTKSGNLDVKTLGLRWAGKLPFGFDYGMETAMQRGRRANEPISAWATHLVSGFSIPTGRRVSRVFAEFNRATGDQNPRDGVRGGFDVLFPSSHDKFGVADQFGWTNIVHARSGLQFPLLKNLKLSTAYNSFWLANRRDGIYSSGKLIIPSNGTEGNHIGQEVDFQAQWTFRRHSLFDLAVGHIFPGEFLRRAGRDSAYNCVVLGVTQQF